MARLFVVPVKSNHPGTTLEFFSTLLRMSNSLLTANQVERKWWNAMGGKGQMAFQMGHSFASDYVPAFCQFILVLKETKWRFLSFRRQWKKIVLLHSHFFFGGTNTILSWRCAFIRQLAKKNGHSCPSLRRTEGCLWFKERWIKLLALFCISLVFLFFLFHSFFFWTEGHCSPCLWRKSWLSSPV